MAKPSASRRFYTCECREQCHGGTTQTRVGSRMDLPGKQYFAALALTTMNGCRDDGQTPIYFALFSSRSGTSGLSAAKIADAFAIALAALARDASATPP